MGSHFVRAQLAAYPHDTIVNADCLTYAGSLDNLEEAAANSRHRHVNVDTADEAALDALWEEPFDLVVHFAAETHVDRSLENAGTFVRTNVLGTQAVLSVALRRRDAGARSAVVIVSSDEVYGPTPDGTAFGTDQPLAPTSPYAASKAAADWMALAYRRTHELDVTIVRSVNVYGPRQYPEKFIPLFVTRALASESLPLYGDGRQKRSWLYVEDFVGGLMAILSDTEKRRAQPVWHLGSHEEMENRQIAEAICKLSERETSLISRVADRPGHDRRYSLDYSETTKVFGWEPKNTFADGLNRTVAWIREHQTWHRERAGWTPAFLER